MEALIYLQLGFRHILDLDGYDHLLFLLALCAPYVLNQWKKIILLATGFTIGHSLTLVLAVLNVLIVSSDIIEFLIPLTIFITAVLNLFRNNENKANAYAFATGFGLIHGMGFSNYFRALLRGSDNILLPLFSFNLGVELGQVVIVGSLLGVLFVLRKTIEIRYDYWNYGLSGVAAIISVFLMIETKFW